jgi:23S rRNA pseudouridine1911/1915/1917 synthase
VVRCELLTGRTHQIRVHLAALGYPIVGDQVYGEADAAVPRQALHAWRLSLPDPGTRETLELEAPVAQDLRSLITDPS